MARKTAAASPGLTRRQAMRWSALGICVGVMGGVALRANDQRVLHPRSGPAYEPWTDWRRASGPMAMIAAGCLASNPHNTQPWLFRLDGDRLDILADTSRHLGAMDPFYREMTIGLGCAIENMVLIAAREGLGGQVRVEQGRTDAVHGDAPTLIATIDLAGRPRAPSPLADALDRRHTNRGPYVPDRPLPADLRRAWADAVRPLGVGLVLLDGGPARQAFDALTVRATEAIAADPDMLADSDAWFRHTQADIDRHADGITLDAAGLPPLLTAVAKVLPPLSAETSHTAWIDATRDVHLPTAPTAGLLLVEDPRARSAVVAIGRAWQRLHLLAAQAGVAMQPLNQAVEIADREAHLNRPADTRGRLRALHDGATGEAAFAFRAGYAARPAGPSPRRPIDDVLLG